MKTFARAPVRYCTSNSKLILKPTRIFAIGVQTRTMATEAPLVENTNINTAEGVKLDDQKKTLVGCVLDLFAGRPSKAKLQLWDDNAIFEDPLAYAQGRKQYEAQWVSTERPRTMRYDVCLTNESSTVCKPPSPRSSARATRSPRAETQLP